MTDAYPDRLGPTDSVLWEIERDPVLRSPILVVALLDGVPDTARLTAAFERAVTSIPRLHQRVVPTPLRGGLRWEQDPSFSLDHHLRRVRAPHPADLRAVLDLARPILSGDFDRQRALWEAHVVDGLGDGRSALVLKIHHAATDGVGGVALAGSLFDTDPDGTHISGDDFAPLPESRLRRLLDEASGIGALTGTIASSTAQAIRQPVEFAREAVRTAGSVADLLRPIRRPLSSVMVGRSLTRHLDVIDVPMADLARAAHRAGGTLNDAYLAAIAHGLARYHELHGRPVPALRVTMPINFRHEGDPPGGNRFAPVRFEIPLGIDDASDRIRALGAIAHRWRDDPAIGFTEAIAAGIRLLPPAVAATALGSMFKAVDVDAVNVPGVPMPMWLAGAGIERLYAFAPPTGAALSVTLLSHLDTACIGIQTDGAAVTDPAMMTACLREGLDEVLAVGAPHPTSGRAKTARERSLRGKATR